MEVPGINIHLTETGTYEGSISPKVLSAFLSKLKSSPTGKVYFKVSAVKEPTERLTHRMRLKRESMAIQPAGVFNSGAR